MNPIKKIILSTLLGLGIVYGAFAAGTYTENFNSYNNAANSGFSNGGALYRTGDGGEVWYNSTNWRALRLIGDNNNNDASTFLISGVENSGQVVNEFNVTFGLLFKNDGGLSGADIADHFSFNFGNIPVSGLPRAGNNGAWSSGQSGGLLSIVWDFYDNDTGNGSGDSNNNDRIGVEVYRNGSLVSDSFRAIDPSWVVTSVNSPFNNVQISWRGWDTGLLNMTVNGTSVYSNFNFGGLPLDIENGEFAFSGATGAESMDVFVDDISLTTVPEPSAGALLMLGIGGLMALRRARRG
jgi:hypothetical protein